MDKAGSTEPTDSSPSLREAAATAGARAQPGSRYADRALPLQPRAAHKSSHFAPDLYLKIPSPPTL